MNKRTGGEVLIDGLSLLKIQRIFCVPGESYLGALDALYQRKQPKIITCRQEGGASYMAEAHAKLTGQPGICFVSRGPGASNAMIGLHTAYQDSSPLLLFIGQIPRAETHREAFQELNYQLVFQGVAKKVLRIDCADRIPELLNHAWHTAMSGRPGPVVIELPEDVLRDQTKTRDIHPAPVSQTGTSASYLQPLQKQLQRAKKPLIIAGGPKWNSNCHQLLAQVSEKFKLPVVTVFRRNDCFDNSHANYWGDLGIAPNPKLLKRVKQSDLLLTISARLGDITTSGYCLLKPEEFNTAKNKQKLIHVHPSAEEPNSVFRAELAINSDPEPFLQALLEMEAVISHQVDITSGHADFLEHLRRTRNQQSSLRMDQIAQYLRNHLSDDTILTVGAGNYATWPQHHYMFRKFQTFLGSTNGSMGYAVPAAIAAKFEKPDCMVISFSGDGCFLMNGQELATAVQYHLGILFLVINNQCYGTIKAHQQRHYPNRPVATQLVNPDFSALANSYGALGLAIDQTADFPATLKQAMAWMVEKRLPALIELQIDY